MLKKLIAATCFCAIAIPAVAIGGPPPDPEYGGKLDGKKSRYIGFDVKGKGGDRRITNGFLTNIYLDCPGSGNDGTQSGGLEKPVDVKANGIFDETKKYDFDPVPPPRRGDDPTGIKYRLRGDLDGDRAEGTVRVQLLGNDCDSGTVDFVAKKPAPPVPAEDRR